MFGSRADTFTKNTVHFEFPDLEFLRGIKTFFWASLISIGFAFTTVIGVGSKNPDGSSSNPVGNAIGNLFGGSENSASNGSRNIPAASSNISPQEALRRQMANTQAPQIGGNNSPMAQSNQAAQQVAASQNQQELWRKLRQQKNGDKGNQR